MPRWIAPFLLLWLSTGILQAQLKPAPAHSNSLDFLDDHHIIKPGNTISIRMLEDRRDAEQFRVPKNGMIENRYLGAIKAEGLTCLKLAKFIRQKLVALPAHTLPFSYSGAPTVVVTVDNPYARNPPALTRVKTAAKLQPGRTIGIRIVEDKRDELQQVIAITGEVQAPYLGLVKAAGLTCAELAAKIKCELEKSFFRRATVLVTLYSTELEPKEWVKGCFPDEVICVFGNVAKAGKYEWPQKGDLTVSGFLKWAGGHTSKKPLPKIQIVRKTPQGIKRILVDAEAILIRKSKKHDLFLRSYDVMLVD